jgi:hypothetical protein
LQIEDAERFVNLVKNLKNHDETTKSPLLIAAKYGCHKILKSILDMNEKMQDEPYNINLNDSNTQGENVLHLGIIFTYDFKMKIVKIFQNIISTKVEFNIRVSHFDFSSKTSTTVYEN